MTEYPRVNSQTSSFSIVSPYAISSIHLALKYHYFANTFQFFFHPNLSHLLKTLRVLPSHQPKSLLWLTRPCVVCSCPPLQPHLHSTFPSHIGLLASPRLWPRSSPTEDLGIAFLSIWKATCTAALHVFCFWGFFLILIPQVSDLCVREIFPDHYINRACWILSPRVLFTSFIIYDHTLSLFCLLVVSSLRAGVLSTLFTAISPAPSI